jgi:cystathionine gamma-synthase
VRDPERLEPIRELAVTLGMNASPFDCWLAERGLNTFDLRFDRAQESAARLADVIAGCAGVAKVVYPGRADHPDHELARALMGGNGGSMVCFELDGGRDHANRLIRALHGVPFAPTLGDVGTTISHPASSSHRSVPEERRRSLGISQGLLRVSVGIEDVELLERTFRQALADAAS